jgi:hypothetical protein
MDTSRRLVRISLSEKAIVDSPELLQKIADVFQDDDVEINLVEEANIPQSHNSESNIQSHSSEIRPSIHSGDFKSRLVIQSDSIEKLVVNVSNHDLTKGQDQILGSVQDLVKVKNPIESNSIKTVETVDKTQGVESHSNTLEHHEASGGSGKKVHKPSSAAQEIRDFLFSEDNPNIFWEAKKNLERHQEKVEK